MIKRILTLFIALFLISTKGFSACGYSEPIYLDFYELFIADNNRPQEYDAINQANIKAWKAYFNGYYDNVEEIVYKLSPDEIDGLLQKAKKKKIKEALKYLKYAKEMEAVSNRFSQPSGTWDYYMILEQHDYNEQVFADGVKGMKGAKSREIQLRYAYQVIRYLHYSKMYKEAVDFYNEYIKTSDNTYEIYYYCLDQVSGCYYSLGDYPQSAYGFLQVYMNSGDRKVPALNSFRIHYQWDFEKLLALCQNDTEKAYAKTLVTGSFYNVYDAEWVLNNAFDEKVLLSIYYYNNAYLEGRYHWMNENNYKWMKWSDEENIELDKSLGVLSGIVNHENSQHKDFWYSCMAYLHYIKGDFKEANTYAEKIKSVSLVKKERLDFFKSLFDAGKTGEVNDEVENKFYSVFLSQIVPFKGAEHNFRTDIFYTFLKLYYYHNNENLKANLVSLSKGDADQIYDLEELNDLQNLFEDKNKSELEAFLLKKALGDKLNVTDYVTEKKGSYYLMQNEFEKALSYFKKLPKDYDPKIMTSSWSESNYQFNGYSNVPAQVFSANVEEGFQFKMDFILTDKTYLYPQFSFINKTFTKKELTEYLVKLKQMAELGNSNAYYLLGNYYYNLSELGYFRNLLIYYPENNYCWSCQTHKLLNNYNNISYLYYQKALAGTSNRETQAKITYMMAKNVAYNRQKDPDMKVYYGLFHSLVSEYKDTKFYKEIIQECGQFNYYAFSLYPAKQGERSRWGY